MASVSPDAASRPRHPRRTAGLLPRTRLAPLRLVALTAFTLSLVAARVAHTGSGAFAFLGWNLLLAWLPWWLAVAVRATAARGSGRWPVAILGVCWLLAFPNAPYVATDLVHLHGHALVPLWFDALMLFCAAWTGCWLGFLSLDVLRQQVESSCGPRAGWAFAAAVLPLGAVGMALGRFERLNSWDALQHPAALAQRVWGLLGHPAAHPGQVAFVLAFGAFSGLAYALVAERTVPITSPGTRS